jgi:predicted Zn-dependent protease
MITTAQHLFDMGCVEDAIINYRKTLRKYPDQKAINLEIAEIYLFMGQFPAARRILVRAGKEKTKKGNFEMELNRLRRVANSVHPSKGGFLELQV